MSPSTTYQRIALGDITVNNLGQLRKLNSVLFPIDYQPSFYEEVLRVEEFAKLGKFQTPLPPFILVLIFVII